MLSICIPTYKRSAMLAELLESIIAEGIADVEVIVTDDASPDDTETVVASFTDRMPTLKYLRHPQNVGMDRNFLAAVAAASGEYVWLMGDDDKIEPGGIGHVLAALKRWPGVGGLTVGVIDYDPTMTEQTHVRAMPDTQRIDSIGAVFGSMAELLGFMSALIVKRREWLDLSADPEVAKFHNYYVQVYLLGKVIERTGSWGVVKEPCVSFRSGNDQLLAKHGWRKRLEIDVEAYEQLAEGLLAADPKSKRAMRKRIFNTHVIRRIQGAKDTPSGDEGALKAAFYIGRRYYDMPRFWADALPRLLVPSRLASAARHAYRRVRSH